MVKTTQGARKMFTVDVYERQKVSAWIRHRAGRTVSDQSMDVLHFHKAGFRR